MLPNLDNGGRWHHILSEREVRKALRDQKADIFECPAINITFLVSRRFLTVLRCGAGGGDVFNVEGGWVYDNEINFLLDVNEISTLTRIPV